MRCSRVRRPGLVRSARLALVGLTLLAGCAPLIPEAVRRDVDRGVAFAALIRDPEAYRGRTVLLGGDILSVSTLRDVTELEVLERPLDAFDRPGAVDASGGRFLVRHSGFLDSAIYARARTLTLVGRVAGSAVRAIGETPYRYPVLEDRALYLWPVAKYEPIQPYPWPYWGDPWWPHPWWGPRYLYWW